MCVFQFQFICFRLPPAFDQNIFQWNIRLQNFGDLLFFQGTFADEFRGFEIIVFHDAVLHRWAHIMKISTQPSEGTYVPYLPFVFVSFALVVVTFSRRPCPLLTFGVFARRGCWAQIMNYQRFREYIFAFLCVGLSHADQVPYWRQTNPLAPGFLGHLCGSWALLWLVPLTDLDQEMLPRVWKCCYRELGTPSGYCL